MGSSPTGPSNTFMLSTQVTQASIEEAKARTSSHDLAHDINHARRTAENSVLIGKKLNYRDLQLLHLAGWWHDVSRNRSHNHEKDGAIEARDDALGRGVNKENSHIIYEAIRYHKWSMTPRTIEGNIIRDADKLDFISI